MRITYDVYSFNSQLVGVVSTGNVANATVEPVSNIVSMFTRMKSNQYLTIQCECSLFVVQLRLAEFYQPPSTKKNKKKKKHKKTKYVTCKLNKPATTLCCRYRFQAHRTAQLDAWMDFKLIVPRSWTHEWIFRSCSLMVVPFPSKPISVRTMDSSSAMLPSIVGLTVTSSVSTYNNIIIPRNMLQNVIACPLSLCLSA